MPLPDTQQNRDWRVASVGLAVFVVAIAACGTEPRAAPPDSDDEPAASSDTGSAGEAQAPPGDSVADDWTAGITVDTATVATGTAVVTAVRTGVHEGYDRVTVEFAGDSSLPGYHIEYVDRPLHECGSGRQIHPVGDAWLEIRLDGAAAHTEAGTPTLPGREIDVAGPLLRRMYRTCDFEGVVTFVAAVASPQPYRVMELTGPSRLVIDFRHQRPPGSQLTRTAGPEKREGTGAPQRARSLRPVVSALTTSRSKSAPCRCRRRHRSTP